MNLVKQNSLLTALVSAVLLFCSMPARSQCRAEFRYTVEDSLEVEFNEVATTVGGPVSYFWRFGDGQFATQRNPHHRYQHPGEYFVELKIQNSNCNDIYRDTICVRCVFPGDANDDGIVNNNDALYLGIAFGHVGPVRPPRDTGGANVPWVESNGPANFHNGVNMQHGDCDGDGVIGRADFAFIRANYNRTSQKTNTIAECASINDVPLFFVVPDSIEMGSPVSVEVHLGTVQNPAVDVYGISFSVNYESELIDSGTFTFDYTNSLFGDNTETGSLDIDVPAASRVETAITRIDQNEQTIAGYIGTLSFVMEENFAQKTSITDILNLSFADITLIKADETVVAVCPYVDSAVVYEKQLSSSATTAERKLFSVYPNPANNFLKIEFPGAAKYELAVMNVLGKKILGATGYGSNYLNTSTLAKGVYFLHLRSENTLQIIKFEIAR